MQQALEQYKVVVEFLGQALGPDYEIVLHDLSSGKNEIVAIANGSISGREVGAPLTNLALKFIAEKTYEHKDYEVGYPGISPRDAKLYTSTMFIKNPAGKLIGILCINYDTSRCTRALEALRELCGSIFPDAGKLGAPAPDMQEKFQGSVRDLVRASVEEIIRSSGVPAERMTMDEKIAIVERLNEDGVFYLKGTVSEVAEYLSTSEATIYRYLSKLK